MLFTNPIRALLRARRLGTEILTFKLQAESGSKDFKIHRDLFRASATGVAKPGPNQTIIKLTKDWKANAFEAYTQYLYTGKFPVLDGNGKTDRPLGQWEVFTDIFLIAEHFGNVEAMNASTDALVYMCQSGHDVLPQSRLVTKIYKMTACASPFRRLVVDCYLAQSSIFSIQRSVGDFDLEFFRDLSLAMFHRRRATVVSTRMQCCNYHVHDRNQECSSKKRKRTQDDVGGGLEARTKRRSPAELFLPTMKEVEKLPSDHSAQLQLQQPSPLSPDETQDSMSDFSDDALLVIPDDSVFDAIVL